MIRIVDYGVGNIQAFLNVYKRLGVEAGRARKVSELDDATHLILPGVGAFDHAMRLLNESGLREHLEHSVIEKKIPILGVCVGMQMLASGSDEGVMPGLNWVPGRVRSFQKNKIASMLPLPHMGWNDIKVDPASALLQGMESAPRFYFLHSYYFDCDDLTHVAAKAQYGIDFDCVVSNKHIHGVQCHPEKSHHWGSMLLKNFSEI